MTKSIELHLVHDGDRNHTKSTPISLRIESIESYFEHPAHNYLVVIMSSGTKHFIKESFDVVKDKIEKVLSTRPCYMFSVGCSCYSIPVTEVKRLVCDKESGHVSLVLDDVTIPTGVPNGLLRESIIDVPI